MLDCLNKEIIDQNMAKQLDLYMQKKSVEVENSKLHMKMSHTLKICSIYDHETEDWNKFANAAAETLQDNFLLLRSMGELEESMNGKYQALSKMLLGLRTVKFAEDELTSAAISVCSSSEASDCPNFHNIMNLSDDLMQTPQSGKKRHGNAHEADIESKKAKRFEEFDFARPKALKSINFDSSTARAAPVSDGSTLMNMTFDLNSGGLGQQNHLPISLSAASSSTNVAVKSKMIYKQSSSDY